ncbi:EpsG family protein [Sphingobacterium sp. UDSM-2020]|uniref:EpsG family protein n=1 Tax=Sphingobacterium sp. UDSM-2020 TaxID=2795738 RepID=UPI001934CEDF|nr:EpsG family protein [Sphingobacterium sp. UDSM-2020]QQD15381.1 EpsG family protein [Sphingobacterium sp. UDSM-2020]
MSIDFIPIASYSPIYYHVLLIITLITFLYTQGRNIDDANNLLYIKIAGFLLFWFVLLYMGLRPIDGVFADMKTYARIFDRYEQGAIIRSDKDLFFHLFMKASSGIMSASAFFFVCALFYVYPLYFLSKRWFGQYWFYAFLMLVGSFSFWAYGTNGIRNGMATSFFLMAMCQTKKPYQIFWLFLSVNFHGSMFLPAAGLIATWFYNKPKVFFYFWLLAIPLSLLLPGFWEGLFASLIEDDRTVYLSDDKYADSFSSTGFRWDFLLYSATGVFAGWYYIFKRKFNDPQYIRLFNTFLFANAFWILVIRASFSNRFAYLSWFMLALVIIYPWLKVYFVNNQVKKMGLILIAYFAFTYLMNIFIYG